MSISTLPPQLGSLGRLEGASEASPFVEFSDPQQRNPLFSKNANDSFENALRSLVEAASADAKALQAEASGDELNSKANADYIQKQIEGVAAWKMP